MGTEDNSGPYSQQSTWGCNLQARGMLQQITGTTSETSVQKSAVKGTAKKLHCHWHFIYTVCMILHSVLFPSLLLLPTKGAQLVQK